MLEIIVLWALCKKIGTMVKEKGRSSGGYIILAIVLWIGGEILGAIVGTTIAYTLDNGACVVYVVALLGAAVGAAIAYGIAKAASPVTPAYTPPQVTPPGPAVSYDLPPAPPVYQPGPAVQAYPAAPPQDAGIQAAACPNCGYMVTPADRFCPSCGSRLAWDE